MDQSIGNVRRRVRPAQRLYVPPAKRTTNLTAKELIQDREINKNSEIKNPTIAQMEDNNLQEITHNVDNDINNEISNLTTSVSTLMIDSITTNKIKQEVIVTQVMKKKSDLEMDKEKEEMQRAIVNINRKSRPLIKHVNVKNDILQINVSKSKTQIKVLEVEEWEDLYNEEDEDLGTNETIEPSTILDYHENYEDSSDDEKVINYHMADLEHVIELYDFPSTFKTQDLMQIYNDIDQESMYIKWCDETHALLVLGSLVQAQKALVVRNDVIKSRPMTLACPLAVQVASKSDLKPAMKRPQTCMHAARRMITTALGTKSRISREVQEKEREALRKAKLERQTQRQNERDAWDGFPRPSTA